MSVGTYYGIDVGAVRVGVARSVSSLLPAMPVTTLQRDPESDSDIQEMLRLMEEETVKVVYVGLPLNLQGKDTPSTKAARDWAHKLAMGVDAKDLSVRIRLVDERLTTSGAQRKMRMAGRSSRNQRSVIDQQAAVEILQQALDMEQSLQREVGEHVIAR